MAEKTTTPATSQPPKKQPRPFNVNLLAKRFGMTRQDVYALALMEAIAEQHNHQPRRVAPGKWEVDSYGEPGEIRTVTLVERRLLCNCPAAQGDQEAGRPPRICSHSASVHMLICRQMEPPIEPPVPPMPAWVLRYDPSPEAKAALALIARPPKAKTPPAAPEAHSTTAPVLAEVQR
jgi:hypothetical protein